MTGDGQHLTDKHLYCLGPFTVKLELGSDCLSFTTWIPCPKNQRSPTFIPIMCRSPANCLTLITTMFPLSFHDYPIILHEYSPAISQCKSLSHHVHQPIAMGTYPLVNSHITMVSITIINRTNNYKWLFSIANCQSLLEGSNKTLFRDGITIQWFISLISTILLEPHGICPSCRTH